MSSSLLPEVEENPAGLFAILPIEAVQYLVDFLGLYESLGLGSTSRWFRELLQPVIARRFHYEPWGYDPTYDGPILTEIWKGLGEYTIGVTAEEERGPLQELAVRAYREINHRVYHVMQTLPKPGVGFEIVANLAKNTSAGPRDYRTIYNVNCLAVLTLDDKQVWALNFQVPWLGDLPERLRAVTTRARLEPATYIVKKRHAEMRLIVKLAHRNTHGHIAIDKVCCVFCASQLIALGYRNVVVGWNRGNLNWYTFSPLVLYFQKERRAMWGDAIDVEFMSLSLPHKLAFLRMLVAQTKVSPQPQLVKRGRDPALDRDRKRIAPDPSLNLPGPCPMCGRYECWEDYNDGKGWQLNCPELADFDPTI